MTFFQRLLIPLRGIDYRLQEPLVGSLRLRVERAGDCRSYTLYEMDYDLRQWLRIGHVRHSFDATTGVLTFYNLKAYDAFRAQWDVAGNIVT